MSLGLRPHLPFKYTPSLGSGNLRWGGDDFGPITWALI